MPGGHLVKYSLPRSLMMTTLQAVSAAKGADAKKHAEQLSKVGTELLLMICHAAVLSNMVCVCVSFDLVGL